MDRSTVEGRRDSCRVLVIDDHELLSSALEVAFKTDERADVVGTASSIAEGVERAGALHPDVILTDRRLPDGDVDQHVGDLLAASPTSRILMMTGWPTERSSLAALDAGVAGIISKTEPLRRIVEAVGRVAAGDLVVPADLARSLLERAGGGGAGARRTRLSPRELDVLEALAGGESTWAAAVRLCISHNTLRNNLSQAMLKLGVHDRLSAVSEAIRLGLIAPPMPGSAGSIGAKSSK
jgi:DNA-binding NarL/FixJ family response regulator